MKSKQIAESGIFIALTVGILYSTSILPISTLSILTVASCLIPISLVRTTSIKYSFLIYICGSILSLFLVPINISLSYILFFGIYGLIKYYIEKLKKYILEIFLKLCVFNILISIIYFALKAFIDINLPQFPMYLIIILSQIIFLIYDYAITLVISIYIDKLHSLKPKL